MKMPRNAMPIDTAKNLKLALSLMDEKAKDTFIKELVKKLGKKAATLLVCVNSYKYECWKIKEEHKNDKDYKYKVTMIDKDGKEI